MPDGKFEQPPQFEKGSEKELEKGPEKEPGWVKEVFEVAEKEIKLRETLEQWVEDMRPELQQRAKHFGLEKSRVEEIMSNLESSFYYPIYVVKDPKERERLKTSSAEVIAKKISDEEKRTKLRDLLSQLSKKNFLDLLNRKLQGDITPEEKTLLDIFSYVEKGSKVGTHDPLSGKIEVSLLNSNNLKEYKCVLMHEFTHKVLSDFLVPKEKRREMINNLGISLAIEQMAKEQEMSWEEIPEEVKAQRLFFQILTAIEESFAHRVADYYRETKRKPQYISYRNQVDPEFFKAVYLKIDNMATNKSLTEFDHATAYIYSFLIEKWRKDLSLEDIEEILKSTVKEINKFRGK